MYMNDNIQKTCGFYVSDFHLVTMLLPHIVTEIEKGTKIYAIMNKNITNEVKQVISRLNINDIVKKKILNINWNKTTNNDFNFIKYYMDEITKEKIEIEIIITGSKAYIDTINRNIEYWMDTNKEKTKDAYVNLINCYEVAEYNSNINSILNENNFLINTSGIKPVEEIFEARKKKAV